MFIHDFFYACMCMHACICLCTNTYNKRHKKTVNIMVDYIRCGSNAQNCIEKTHLNALDTCLFEAVVDDAV